MKRYLKCTVALLFLTCTRSPVAGGGALPQESPCWQSASTQLAINQCAAEDAQKTDAALNQTYERLLSKYADDPGKVARIKKAQRAWIVFRDAEVDAYFPKGGSPQNGSVTPMCRLLELTSLTAERAKELKAILEARDGDVCNQ